MSELTIVSTVATGNINREIDLEALSEDLNVYSCEYNPDKSPALLIRFYDTGPTVSVFRTGSINIRGAKKIKEISENRELLEKELSRLRIDVSIPDLNITNIVFTADLDKEFDLNKLSVQLGLDSVEYEPEQFPGLTYRLEKGVVLIFTSGKLVLTGFTTVESAEQAYKNLKLELINE